MQIYLHRLLAHDYRRNLWAKIHSAVFGLPMNMGIAVGCYKFGNLVG
jgi:hypothetical protein